MKLRDYLDATKTGVREFARQCGISPARVLGLTGPRSWPGRESAACIARATRGAVLPNDWLIDPKFPEPGERAAVPERSQEEREQWKQLEATGAGTETISR